MKSSAIGNGLLFAGCCLVGFSIWSYLDASSRIDPNNCGVAVQPAQTGRIELPSFTDLSSVPLKMVNSTGKPAKVVGNNACCGFAFDFGARQVPFSIEAGETFDFNLNVHTLAAGELDVDFVIYMDVQNVLIQLPVAFKLHVVDAKDGDAIVGDAENEEASGGDAATEQRR